MDSEKIYFDLWTIRITKIPAGPAPLEVRQAWVGTLLLAYPYYLNEGTLMHGVGLVSLVPSMPINQPERDFLTGAMVAGRDGFVVPVEVSLEILENTSPSAASWFRTHVPPDMQHFTFGRDEAVIEKELTVVTTLEELNSV